ncbi:MAG: methyltransferase domain-containing protein [Patescibacteria group bacterium]
MFTPLSGRVVGSLVAEGKVQSGARAVELGAQTYSVNAKSIRFIQNKLTKAGKQPIATALERFSTITPARKPRDPAPHMEEFFTALGFSSYTAIDISDYGKTVIMDLNEDVREKYAFTETYDLVTNIGVSEHLINQYIFFKNAHMLTAPGGYMVHIVPSVHYANHGFFNYQPRFFLDLAAANEYEIIDLFLGDREERVLELMRPTSTGVYFYPHVPALSGDPNGNLLVVAVLRKKNSAPFRTPLQGKYVPDVTHTEDQNLYQMPDAVVKVATKGYFYAGVPDVSVRLKQKALRVLRAIERLVLKM